MCAAVLAGMTWMLMLGRAMASRSHASRYTRQLVALHLYGPGVVSAASVSELQRRMALIESATSRTSPRERAGMGR